ncbi:MAG: peptide deformylase [Kiritimatiellaeota bacterium]|nr:peptide deformylase [Kiritimatiellota bacterium]
MNWHEMPLNFNASPLQVCIYGAPVLRRKSVEVSAITPELREFARRMIATMHRDRGIGLAAPQVGRSIRVIAIHTRSDDGVFRPNASPGERLLEPLMPVILVNPRVVPITETTGVYEEGCLSVPGIHADVVRPTGVILEAMTLDGESFRIECTGLLARCLQHEIDHLDGVLFVDRISEDDARRIAPGLRALKKRARRERLLRTA